MVRGWETRPRADTLAAGIYRLAGAGTRARTGLIQGAAMRQRLFRRVAILCSTLLLGVLPVARPALAADRPAPAPATVDPNVLTDAKVAAAIKKGADYLYGQMDAQTHTISAGALNAIPK